MFLSWSIPWPDGGISNGTGEDPASTRRQERSLLRLAKANLLVASKFKRLAECANRRRVSTKGSPHSGVP